MRDEIRGATIIICNVAMDTFTWCLGRERLSLLFFFSEFLCFELINVLANPCFPKLEMMGCNIAGDGFVMKRASRVGGHLEPRKISVFDFGLHAST